MPAAALLFPDLAPALPLTLTVQEKGAERMRYYSDAVLYGTQNPYRPLDNAKYNLVSAWWPSSAGSCACR